MSRSYWTSGSIAVSFSAPSSPCSGFLLVVQLVRGGAGVAEVGVELALPGSHTRGQIAGLPHRAHGALDTIRAPRGDFPGQFESAGAELSVGDHRCWQSDAQVCV